ncbi:MAG: ABC transporter permease, partial [Gemmatimonadota bacterium]|nr:ABC transporter permease [Gemmatimonadota bacterium]
MLGNYLTTALRLLWRERGYAAINIFGLAVGFCLCLLVVQLAAYQLSVGDFHDKKDRVFRVLGPVLWGEAQYTGVLPIPLGPTLKEQLPEVEEAVRFSFGWPRLLRVGDEEGIYEEVRGVEAGVFDMFSLPLLRGDPKTALLRPHTLVLTEPLARRLFGESDPIGQVVRVGEEFDCEVTGIVGPLPSSSLLQFSGLLSLTAATEPMMASGTTVSGWNASAFEIFVQLTPGADPAAVAARIPDIVKEARKLPEAPGAYALQPLKSIYFDTEVHSGVIRGGNPMYLVVCAILAVVILTIAGFNYVNLATARAGRRIHEIGVRKALGAHRGQLMRQLLSESVLLSSAATVLGIVMAEVMVLLLPAITGFNFEWSALRWTSSTYAGAAVLAVGVGLIAGAYPAWVVARFQPATVVQRGRVGGVHLRRGLVVAQFTVTAALLTMTLLIWHQVDYIQNLLRENSILGAKPEQVVVIENKALTLDQARAFKTELLQDSRIAAVSLSHVIPGGGFGFAFRAGEEQMKMNVYKVDSDFVEIMGLRMAQGRALTDEPADVNAVVINETAARMMGLEEPLGETINASGRDSRVVGVIEDFHFHGPRKKIEPLVISQVDGGGGFT